MGFDNYRKNAVQKSTHRSSEHKNGGLTGGIFRGARGVQAAQDSLRRRQKANKAALVKRHTLRKTKLKLLADLETKRQLSDSVPYVAPELGTIRGRGEEEPAEKHTVQAAPQGVPGFRGEEAPHAERAAVVPGDHSVSHTPYPSILPRDEVAVRKPESEASSLEAGPCAISGDGTLSSEHSQRNPQHREAARAVEAHRGSNGSQGKPRKGRYQPYQKEIAFAAAQQAEREAKQARFAQEQKDHEIRRRESASARKQKAAKYRKVTRRGQPVMRHRVEAILEKLEGSGSTRHNSTHVR